MTKDEAREILLNFETEENRDAKSLQSEIKFLRELVEKLSTNRNQIVEVIKEVYTPYRQYPWYNPYITWCAATTTTNGVTGLTGVSASADSASAVSQGYTLNTSGISLTSVGSAFSDISTF